MFSTYRLKENRILVQDDHGKENDMRMKMKENPMEIFHQVISSLSGVSRHTNTCIHSNPACTDCMR